MVILNEKICGYYLDSQQRSIVVDESKYLLVVAGAGSGKTLTIIGKIYYLIKYKKIDPNKILCISFTRASSKSLKEKLKGELCLDIPVYTFHKLALEIIKENGIECEIVEENILDNIINDFFNTTILNYPKQMKAVLNYYNIYFYSDLKQAYLKFIKQRYKKIVLLSNLIATFIRLLKCNNYNLGSFIEFKNKARNINIFRYYSDKNFLILALNIYIIYQNYLKENNEIDFDDMIMKATKIIEVTGIKKDYKYIIIDEYQDTSYIRFCLIKKILDITQAKLMVVGDDFQSIYRFTGCDLSLFVNFEKYFGDAKIMKIETTYRNSNELISVAGNFVMKNKKQIKKNLVSNKYLSKPIKIIYYKNLKDAFIKLILKIYNETHKPILVLGRNNKDVNLVLNEQFQLTDSGRIVYLKNKDIDIKFLTVHKSKGLEEENVIIINLENNLLGFPNKIKDDRVLRYVNNNDEKYLYAEERRLFYVGLTRTKNYVYLLTKKNNPSIFVEELVNCYKSNVKVIK